MLRVPKTVQWLLILFAIYLGIFTAFRIATVVFFKPPAMPVSQLGPAFWLGLKYDLRWISILLLPLAIFSLLKKLNPFYSERTRRFWSIYLGIITLLVLFFYGADFGQFAYINARLNADALIFMEDPQESLKMVWQSYPIVWILIALAGAVLIMTWMFKRTHVIIEGKNANVHKFSYRRRWHLLALLVMCWFIYGFFTAYPLNFFRAFSLNDEFKSNLALNPMQNFFTTLRFRKADFNANAKPYYKDVTAFLNLKAENTLTRYTRVVPPKSASLETQPNVVLVICESFSMYKSSMSGNPLRATPYFDSLTRQGIFFNRCFSPTFGTARGVFGILTGTPDVQLSKFATRNPETISQKTIVNSFTGYDKYYFIGGRSQFNNFGELIKNINGVKIYEEGSYKANPVNVWGISDKDLFLEANGVLAKQTKPFFAIIQTADNHRPYDIPANDLDFKRSEHDPDTLKKYGFESDLEYNAFAYTDYCFKKFIEAARQQAYFENTIFVFVGDHGVEGNALQMYPKAWTEQRLCEEHVPLLFYAPALLQPELHTETVSQIDVLPTVAGMMQHPYTNTTLGRDLLDANKQQDAAFIIYHASGWIGLINNDYFYRKNIRIQKDELVSIKGDTVALSAAGKDSVKKNMSRLTTALYETARYMLVHNHK